MPKDFAHLNYYEMLDIQPDAVTFEVRHAYNAALQIYRPGSLASYSFFPEDERQEILSLIETAYQTLIGEQSRKEYDEELIRTGAITVKQEVPEAPKKPVSVFSISRDPAAKAVLMDNEALKTRVGQSQLICSILAQSELCGADLKSVRTELGVPIEQIAQETKIRHDHLRSIEEDRLALLPAAIFLKGFVKSYLKCLCLEPVEGLAVRYMETVGRLSRIQETEGIS